MWLRELESTGVLLCSMLFLIPLPFLSVPIFLSHLNWVDLVLDFIDLQRGCYSSAAVLGSASYGIFNGISAASRYLGWFHSFRGAWEVLDCDGKFPGQRIKDLNFSPNPKTKGDYIYKSTYCYWLMVSWDFNWTWFTNDKLRRSRRHGHSLANGIYFHKLQMSIMVMKQKISIVWSSNLQTGFLVTYSNQLKFYEITIGPFLSCTLSYFGIARVKLEYWSNNLFDKIGMGYLW